MKVKTVIDLNCIPGPDFPESGRHAPKGTIIENPTAYLLVLHGLAPSRPTRSVRRNATSPRRK